MSTALGPVYEVTLSVDREIAEEFDLWLTEHVSEMLEMPGFLRASTFAGEDEHSGRTRRVTQYFLESDEALENYLAGSAEVMRRETAERFDDRFTARRRVLRPVDLADEPAAPVEACLNCGTPLAGQYCAHCGQRARTRLISIWELVRDAFGDLFELDSRLWKTLIPLAVRPGRLTREYLLGRRARFMPPFRTYLVLSVLFFLVAFFDPKEQLGVLFEPVAQTTEDVEPDPGTQSETAAEIERQVREDLAADGVIVGAIDEGAGEDAGDGGQDWNYEAGSGGVNMDCDLDVDLSGWLSGRLTPERLNEMCERITADNGGEFIRRLVDNIPASLFVLLPLMALVLKILYPLSKRYYAEHLLFVLHFHAFVFLILTLEILFTRFADTIRLEALGDWTAFAVSLYVPVYLYKAMRRVYEQGRIITILKFLFLVMSYLIGLVLILMFVAFYTAISI